MSFDGQRGRPDLVAVVTYEPQRTWPMCRGLAWVAACVMLVACQGVGVRSAIKSPSPRSIVIQPGDMAGMHRCASSGDMIAVLNNEKAQQYRAYVTNATEWEQWKQRGAIDAYFAVYGQTAADCAAASDSSAGAPTSGVMVGLVVRFKDADRAARNFKSDSTLLGFGPSDIRFIELAGGTTTFGSATGLGTESVVGTAEVAGADYYVAEWQSQRFEVEFIGYDVDYADERYAVFEMNRRIARS